MLKKLLLLVATLVIIFPQLSFASGITNSTEFTNPDFWIKKIADPKALLLNKEDLSLFNKNIIKASPSVFDLSSYPATIEKNNIINWLNEDKGILNEQLYHNKKKISATYKQILLSKTNTSSIIEQTKI